MKKKLKKEVVYASIEAERAAIFAMYNHADINKSPIKSDLWKNVGDNEWHKETLQHDKCELCAFPSRDNIEGFACVINGIAFQMPASTIIKAKKVFDIYADAAKKQRDAQGAIGFGFMGNKIKAQAAIKVEMKDTTLPEISAKKLPNHAQGKFTEDEMAEMGVYS